MANLAKLSVASTLRAHHAADKPQEQKTAATPYDLNDQRNKYNTKKSRKNQLRDRRKIGDSYDGRE
jgi:hypothetical protein